MKSACLLAVVMMYAAVFADGYKSIELKTEYEVSASADEADSATLMNKKYIAASKYYFLLSKGDDAREVSFKGDNLKQYLYPSIDVLRQMNLYAGKRIGILAGTAGFVAFGILSATVGMEKGTEKRTSTTKDGHSVTRNTGTVNTLGYAFLGISCLSGVGGLYCYVSCGKNLRTAVNIHNKTIAQANTLSISVKKEM